MALTDAKIRKEMKANSGAFPLPDSTNLRLDIGEEKPNGGSRYAAWIVRTTRQGKTQKPTIGHWPKMSIERARRERDRLTGRNTDLGVTVLEAVQDYRHLVTDDQKSGFQSEVYLRHFIASYGHRRIATVSRADLVSLVKQYSMERGKRSADRYLSQLRGIFNLAVEQGVLDVSPLLGVSKRITGYKPIPRKRVLTPEEIRELWSWEHDNAALLRFLLLTGLRISEGQRGYCEGDKWIVPAHHAKNGKSHWVYLTESAKQQLESRFDVSPTAVQAWIKRRQFGTDRWTPHDCRRTASTLMHKNNVQPFIVERTIGHTLTGLMSTYNQYGYEEERIEAMCVLEHVILEIIN